MKTKFKAQKYYNLSCDFGNNFNFTKKVSESKPIVLKDQFLIRFDKKNRKFIYYYSSFNSKVELDIVFEPFRRCGSNNKKNFV